MSDFRPDRGLGLANIELGGLTESELRVNLAARSAEQRA